KLNLPVACERVNVPLERVLTMLQAIEQSQPEQSDRQWNNATATELITYIVQKHHSFVRSEIPRLEALLVKVNGRHGSSHQELAHIQDLFGAVAQELQTHMFKEERVLFPYIEQLDAASRLEGPEPSGCFPSLE